MNLTLKDRLEDATYMAAYVWPARLAAPAVIHWAAFVANMAMHCGCRRLALRATTYAYDIADHDPADSTWELHRQLMPWAWAGEGRFRPSWALNVAGWWS